MDFQEKVNLGLEYAVAPKGRLDSLLANCLFDELSDQWNGRGLIYEGSGSGKAGKHVIVVSGAIDLVALAQRAIRTMQGEQERQKGGRNRADPTNAFARVKVDASYDAAAAFKGEE